MKIGIEVGGTFTDLIAVGPKGTVVATGKVLSTPADPSKGVLTALGSMNATGADTTESGTETLLVHGSTVATNAVLERKGATVGLLATEGFADLLELQRQDREQIYDLHYRKPVPLVSRQHTREVAERIDASGVVVRSLKLGAALDAAGELQAAGVTAIAVCLLHSYKNPTHEQQLGDAIRDAYPNLQVSISSDVVAEFREYERASTTTIDAFVKPVIESYLGRLQPGAAKLGIPTVWMMQSNGGLLPAAYIRNCPARTLYSGPAAGVTGARAVAKTAGWDDIITMDMGGTSTDVCLVTGGKPGVTTEATIDRLPIKVPMLDIVSIGAGGGSVAWLDTGGMLQIGPQSTGADPGPACYGLGGNQPTTTDANMLRGLIRPGHFLGGQLELDYNAAVTAFAALAQETGREPEPLAEDVSRVAGAAMANAIRLISTERGHDPRRYTLVPYGGAGPLHAVQVAEELGIDRILVPPLPGLISAYGLLVGDFQRDFARTQVSDLEQTSASEIESLFRQLTEIARQEISPQRIDHKQCQVRLGLDLRYRGQGYELTVPVSSSIVGPAELATEFHNLHAVRYGHSTPSEPVEIVTYRLSVIDPQPKPSMLKVVPEPGRQPDERPIIIEGLSVPSTFYWRSALAVGFTASGPAVIEEPTATTYVPPGWTFGVDPRTNLLIQKAPR